MYTSTSPRTSYRQQKGTDTWHWFSECSQWPTGTYFVQTVLPSSGRMCEECEASGAAREVEVTLPFLK